MDYQQQFEQWVPEEEQRQKDEYDTKVKKYIKADNVILLSGAGDSDRAVELDVGVFTESLLPVLRESHEPAETPVTWVSALQRTRSHLESNQHRQVPQLSSSRMIDKDKPLKIVPPGSTGEKRAILIGINYVGQENELTECHNDVEKVKEYLIEYEGFKKDDMTILMDDGNHEMPTKRNIMKALKQAARSEPGDVVFIYYSGHGKSLQALDERNDLDGRDEAWVPVDAQEIKDRTIGGQSRKERKACICDDDIFRVLVRPLKAGVVLTCVVDSCHSGTLLDLPYRYTGGGDEPNERDFDNFDFMKLSRRGLGILGVVSAIIVGLVVCAGE
eukprot:CAMPEP_0116832810 /NCGR_PEP_ID=MMETSP0418-20121206/6096_1 /TAXON_ID=1158023 /ORGANISM="Astrosyne radiata, Strain 13vi08-1A" /LENGTH=329 /DNA_ID=CAMNT_0004462207 /DNA_START=537 /DNA_END=1526 /DNA_ORIENTATION=+